MAKRSTSERRQQSAAAMRAAELRKAQEAKERRRRSIIITVVMVLVIGVIAGVAALVYANQDATGAAGARPAGAVATSSVPDSAGGRYAVPWGEASAPVEVVVYEDFLCPFCAAFEASSKSVLQPYVADGDVQVQYRVLSFLSGLGPYSEMAANAHAVVLASQGQDAAKEFHDALYANQPGESGPFPTADDLVERAVAAGVPEDVAQQGIDEETYSTWVANGTEAAQKEGVEGTPTVVVDGEQIEPSSEQDLVAQLTAKIEAGLNG